MALSHSRRALAREEEDRRLHAFLNHATPAEKAVFNNSFLWALIDTELIEPPDPEHPYATIATLLRTHPEQIRALSALVKTRAFHQQHRRTLSTIYRPLLKQAAGIR